MNRAVSLLLLFSIGCDLSEEINTEIGTKAESIEEEERKLLELKRDSDDAAYACNVWKSDLSCENFLKYYEDFKAHPLYPEWREHLDRRCDRFSDCGKFDR